jgi:hypothetical protein
MVEIIFELLGFFGFVYEADRRPEARSITLGCLAVFLFATLLLGLIVAFRR